MPFGPAGAGDDRLAQFRGARQPGRADRREAIGFKLGLPAGKGHGQQVQKLVGGDDMAGLGPDGNRGDGAGLDRGHIRRGGQIDADADRDRLTDAFSRGFTTAYLDGKRGNDIMSYQRPNNRGLFLGRVDEVRDGAAYLKSAHALTEGDVLEFWTRKGNGTLTLGPVRTDKKGRYHLPLEGKTRTVKAGDRVFRVRSAEAAFEDDAREPRVPLVGTATLHIGVINDWLKRLT